MSTELGLTDHHQNNLIQYLRFCQSQRRSRINTVLALFNETIKTKLTDATYTKEEVEKILEVLKDVIRGEFENELINTNHMNLLLLRQLFGQAEKFNANLFMNLSELEDRELLDAVRIFEDEHFEQKTTKTATILQKLVALEGTIQERAERESEGIIQMRNMIEALVVELDKSKTENERHQMNQAKLVEELVTLQERFLHIKQQLSLKEEELEKKFEATNAYKTMKQILKQKNYQIKQLRMKNANNSGDSDQE